MKTLLGLAIGLMALNGCTQGPKHPQADLIQQNSATAMSEQEILNYTNAIDVQLGTFTKQSSLVFKTTPDESLAIVQYRNANQQPVLYIEYINASGVKDVVSKYYLKNDSLLLVSTQQTQINNGITQFSDQRSYLRNNIIFKREEKSGSDSSSLAGQKFSNAKNPQDKTLNPYQEKLRTFHDALTGANKFELIFDKILQLPDAHYLLLKGKVANGYNASVLIEESDPLIDSLQSDPTRFNGKKINFKWKVKDQEAIYVPVGANLTSANGLNK